MPRYSKADIETHSGGMYRKARPALNVKVYHYPTTGKVEDAFKCSEATASKALEYAFESAQQRFWEDAQEMARDTFGQHVKVYSEGRSGGWLVVEGINEDVGSWDAIAVIKWGRLAKWATREIAFLTSWEYVRDDIQANRWAEDGAEAYNYLDTKDGRTECLVDLKNAHKPAQQ